MNTTKTATTTLITAQPCGRDRHGNPIPMHEYVICRDPEPFDPEPGDFTFAAWDGRHRSRLWGKDFSYGLDRTIPLAVVFTDTIGAVSA